MTFHEFQEFLTRTAPAAFGTALYAFTELGPVAWFTILWITIQMIKFVRDWYLQEQARDAREKAKRDAEDESEKEYP